MKEDSARISEFFDEMSVGRDENLEGDPIMRYEQEQRQKRVLSMLGSIRETSVLDIGCGNARDLTELASVNRYVVGVDISKGMLRDGQRKVREIGLEDRVDLVLASATNLPFKSNSFQAGICSEVIEHIPDYGKAIDEAARVLEEKGVIVFSTPNWLSMYGIWRYILEHTFQRHDPGQHPWDVWKSKSILVASLKKAGLEPLITRGACYIPSHLSYFLPNPMKKILVSIVSRVEEPLSSHLDWAGYVIVASATKRRHAENP